MYLTYIVIQKKLSPNKTKFCLFSCKTKFNFHTIKNVHDNRFTIIGTLNLYKLVTPMANIRETVLMLIKITKTIEN